MRLSGILIGVHDMTEITRDQLDRLYRKQKSLILIYLIGIIAVCMIFYAADILDEKAYLGYIAGAVIAVILFLVSRALKKKLIPEGNGRTVMEAYNYIKTDFLSPNAENFIYRKMSETDNFADKTKLTLFLADIYLFQGRINDAIGMLKAVDRSQFYRHPEVGMSYYSDTIGLYDFIGDTASVLAAYNDAEPFINECAHRNYMCCSCALNILICVERARGNYRKALDMMLMKNEYENKVNNDMRSAEQAPLTRLTKGLELLETAELFYECGNYEYAAKTVDLGGPMVTASPFLTERANELSQKLRNKLSGSAT